MKGNYLSRARRLSRTTRRKQRDDRRGILLLVVLSMLVLFLLIGTTFLVTSGQYRTQAQTVEKANRSTFQPADLLERALMQLVRDTSNRTSVMRHHSLLRDLYGTDGFVGRVLTDSATPLNEGSGGLITLPNGTRVPIAPHYAGADRNGAASLGPTNGQIVEFFVVDFERRSDPSGGRLSDLNAVGLDFDANGLPVEHQMASVDGYYDGCLLTMLSGPCRGQTVRVLSYDHIGTIQREAGSSADDGNESNDTVVVASRWRVMAPRRADGQALKIGTVTLGGNNNPVTQTGLTDFVQSASLGHRFMVNGRPFNGAGVGYNQLALSHDLNNGVPSPRLSAVERVSAGSQIYGMEVALAPNASQFLIDNIAHLKPTSGVNPFADGLIFDAGDPGASDFLSLNVSSPLYRTFTGPGDTDESYDAPDTQNMALASQALEPRLRGRVVSGNNRLDPDLYYQNNSAAPDYLDLEGVTIPSFHRPALANFWFHRLFNSGWLSELDAADRVRAILNPYDEDLNLDDAMAAQITAIKRKFLLRPLREDHPDFDGSNPLSRYATQSLRDALGGNNLVNNNGEITFPYWEAVGPWDVDNDGDGVPDSIWVDAGLPVQQTEDGRWYKPMVAMLVEDMDGRLNLNVHGSNDDLASTNLDPSSGFADGQPRNLAQDYVAGSPLRTSNQLATGAGWGTAETSLRSILSPSLPVDARANGGTGPTDPPFNVGWLGNPQYDDYARLLHGRPDPAVEGRTVANALDVSVPFGRYGSNLVRGLTETNPSGNPQPVTLTKPGRTFLLGRERSLVAVRDPRTPLEFLGYPRYLGQLEERSGFATTPDLGGAYTTAQAAVGAPVDEANTNRLLSNLNGTFFPVVDDSPYELDVSSEARRLAPYSADAVRLSYDPDGNGSVDNLANLTPLVDDAPFSPAELERLLRATDGDADKLPDRLWEIVDSFDPDKLAAATNINAQINAGTSAPINQNATSFQTNSLQDVVASAQAAVNRRSVTTDSFDLPVPNENWAERLTLGADGLPGVPEGTTIAGNPFPADDDGDGLINEGDEAVVGYNANNQAHTFSNEVTRTYDQLFAAGCDDYVVVMRDDPPQSARLLDYLRYRIVLELKRNLAVQFPANMRHTNPTLTVAVNAIISGDDRIAANDPRRNSSYYSFGGLLAPEILAGLKMNLNRPFGDGVDNNGNGVVDEPQEAGEPFVDVNGNGKWDGPADFTRGNPGDSEPFLNRDRSFIDLNNNGQMEPNEETFSPSLDTVWVDDNANGNRDAGELKPFNYTRGADVNGRGGYIETNGEAGYQPGEPVLRDDATLTRQLFARHLYCLMLLLMDENYLAPYDPSDLQARHYIDPLSGRWRNPGATPPTAEPDSSEAFWLAGEIFEGDHTIVQANAADETRRQEAIAEARRLAMRKLTCRMIAQWAINVVDFRDPDAIQTPFEYDENPWDGWNVVKTNNTPTIEDDTVYPLDGDLTTDENYGQRRDVTAAGIGQPTSVEFFAVRHEDRTRGVVWGSERPEAIITEGLAWHDRRLQDLQLPEIEVNGTTVGDGGQVGNEQDDDLDQQTKPKGSVFLELLNPNVGDTQRPAEFYGHVNRTGVQYDGTTLTIGPGIRFDRLSNIAFNRANSQTESQTRSPVWRLVCVEEHPVLRNATVSPDLGKELSNLLGKPIGDIRQVSDDPINEINDGSYLDVTLAGMPWAYPFVAKAKTLPAGTNVFGNSGTQGTAPQLPRGYTEYWLDQQRESLVGMLTTSGNVLDGVPDADGIGMPVGLLEKPPLIADTWFPSFDRFAQPGEAYANSNGTLITGQSSQWEFHISSRIEGTNVGQETPPGSTEEVPIQGIQRPVLLKPTRFLERVFYMAGPNGFDGSQGSYGRSEKDLDGTSTGDKISPLPDLFDPGYRVPELAYEVPIAITPMPFLRELGISDASPPGTQAVGNQLRPRGGNDSSKLRVRVSRFASLDLTGANLPQGADVSRVLRDGERLHDPANPPLPDDLPQILSPIELAPLLPGRRAIVGTAGAVHDPLPAEAKPPVTFTGPDAKKLTGRYATLISRDPEGDLPYSPFLDAPDLANPFAGLRRFEMIPSPNPNAHQFAVRMNGFNDSTTISSGGNPVNITAQPFGAINPVIAIPVEGMSISEPPDEYLLRQLELDPDLEKPWHPASRTGDTTIDSNNPAEGYFGTPGDLTGFDEPFDVLPELVENQTTPNYRSLHLERLANPLLPWNPPPLRVDGRAPIVPDTFANGRLKTNGGQPVLRNQHDPSLPVNPYLPVDAKSLDLTAFNGFNTVENEVSEPNASTEFAHFSAPSAAGQLPGAQDLGPERRHRTPRMMPDATGTMQTVIGFASNERTRPLGPFPALWALEPARLLWEQSQGSTVSELIYQSFDRGVRPGYLVEVGDQVKPGDNFNNPTGDYALEADQAQMGGYRKLAVDFPWRMTFGFPSWLESEFYTASGFAWKNETAPDGPAAEIIDLDGDGNTGDLIAADEVNDDPNTNSQMLNANGQPAALYAGGVPATAEAAAANPLRDNSTTPAFHWPNRPFASAGELLQVPMWGGSRMLGHYSTFNWLHTQKPGFNHETQVNPYNGEDGGPNLDHDGLDYNLSAVAQIFDGNFANDFGPIRTVTIDNTDPGTADDTMEAFDQSTNFLVKDRDNRREGPAVNQIRWRETLGHFGHLINFFQTARFPSYVEKYSRTVFLGADGEPNTEDDEIEIAAIPRGASHFYRILDYVHVPSRFVGTETLLNADVFGEANLALDDPRVALGAPFNQVDRYREPGRINLNTIAGRGNPDDQRDRWSEIYDGLMHRVKDKSLINDAGTPGDSTDDELVEMGHLGPAWRDVELSRRGYIQPDFDPTTNNGAIVNYSPRRMHPGFPTFYANPFRAPGEGANVPLASMVQTGVDATILRAHPLSPGADGAWGVRGSDDGTVDGIRDDASESGLQTLELALQDGSDVPTLPVLNRLAADVVLARFESQSNRRGALPDTFMDDAFRATPNDQNPREATPQAGLRNTEISKRATPVALFSGATIEPSLDTERNATTRYQPIQRMESLATTRSNVYAAWITIGFFEVKPADEDQRLWSRFMTDANGDGIGDTFIDQARQEAFFRVYPDGWTLGQELDLDTGQNERHRGFYLIDRSRPVAFRPGEDANVDETILLRRRIE